MAKETVFFELNGRPVQIEVDSDAILVDVLREDLRLTGTKRGCGNGECGACTVIIDGEPVASCIYPAVKVQGKKVVTIEGLGTAEKLHPLQKYFLRDGAVQCGFCTPGELLTAKALLDKNPNPAEEEILQAISGNLCRCTGYKKIAAAVKNAAAEIRGEEVENGKLTAWDADSGAIGRSVPRKEGVAKVLGQAVFADDLQFPGMLYGMVLRSKYPHALIKGINTDRASALPGVEAVLTSKDIPGSNKMGILAKDEQALAGDRVRFIGEPVALVAARSKSLAREALKLIEVDYDPLPVVNSPLEAMAEGAVKVHPQGNVQHHRKIRSGNIEEAFRQAHLVVEDTFKTQLVEHAYLEPESGVALLEGDTMTIYAVSQGPHYQRNEVASVLGWPVNRVRIAQTTTGGGFGGKIDVSVHPYIALLALKTGKPVKMTYSRAESMAASTKRHPFIMKYKLGVDREGRLVAAEVEIIGDTGAYASFGPAVLTRSAVCALGPYYCPNVKIDAYAVYTNNPIAGAMRGFGSPQMSIAHEALMDLLAEKLGLSPVEIRRRNVFKDGSVTHTGQLLKAGVGMSRTLEEAARESGLQEG